MIYWLARDPRSDKVQVFKGNSPVWLYGDQCWWKGMPENNCDWICEISTDLCLKLFDHLPKPGHFLTRIQVYHQEQCLVNRLDIDKDRWGE